ncbi:MAG: hemerythrin domain-containing protein [Bacteroidetes bacterium]|nr:hemerythrin domain-containing protein [Bacteroidota bacterium]
MKRHIALVPLSHDHHQGLLLVWKIRQGINWRISNSRMSKYILYFSEHDLLLHFHKEETILIIGLPPNDPLAQQMLQEHKKLRESLQAIKNNENEITFINEFANLLEGHIRFEERILFPHIQETTTLDNLAEQWKENTDVSFDIDQHWEDHFWNKK